MEIITENIPTNKPEHDRTRKQAGTHTLSWKILFIGLIMLALLIPGGMILSLINERSGMMESAQSEVARMWSGEQHLTGPVITIPYLLTIKNSAGEIAVLERELSILPDRLTIDGDVKCQKLRRGLYDTNVYNAEMLIAGAFESPAGLGALLAEGAKLQPEFATVAIGISDLRGIEESVEIAWNGRSYPTATLTRNNCFDVGVAAQIDLREWLATPRTSIPFELKLKLKGSTSLNVAPVGNQNTIRIKSDCPTPSFVGNFLPSSRNVTEQGFDAEWKVVAQNRNYTQLLTSGSHGSVITQSELGVDLLIPVTQYQQATRAIKYAALVILLTFIGVFFVEMTQHKNIHAFQYLLVGLGLILFYSLLVSISEHLSFLVAYLISAAMTVALITAYIYGVTRLRSTALSIGGMLTLLYTYVYVLLQLESYALLTGSIGLFVILAVVMRYSLKMKWTGAVE
ncbi:cell envelope integrity protein CreD [uncultured Alistipes sp.]|jgi:inner membrane protein creD|uniref:cell envelope integrity protein CreD n=1 Tax=uncultured Alistipes sp. TaxID=538949 RepID=UPI0025D49824|nr:cell envelope integrity protein CreD [uncultured Alistipes sp.]